ncbi:hypothetical protein ACFL2F_02350 [Myxococcota bacterium]
MNGVEKQIVPFFKRLEGLGGMLLKCTGGGFSSVVEFSESKNRILLDLSTDPVRVRTGGHELDGTVGMTGSREDLQQIFLGKLPIVDGIAQRRLLLKGGMCYLVKMFPILDQTPVLYADHLHQPKPVGPIRRGLARFFGWIFAFFAGLAGRMLRKADRRQVLAVLGAMSRGTSRFSPGERMRKKSVRKPSGDNPLDAPPASLWRRTWIGVLRFFMYMAGWELSLFKYKLGFPVDLFAILGRFSDGLKE